MDRGESQASLTSRRPHRPSPRDQQGYALLALVVMMGVIAMTAAAIGPNLARDFRVRQIRYAVASLDGIGNAAAAFYDHVTDWPGSLQHLQRAITTSDMNICGMQYPVGKVANWKGPYLLRVVPPTGLPITIGTVRDQVFREKDTSGGTGAVGAGSPYYLVLEITGVSLETAYDLNRARDNDYTDGLAGAVQWGTPDVDGFVTVRYRARRILAC